ncbi:MAG: hypothetical protein AABX88_02210 [Nanoarchaeota archaeon]
MKIKENIKGLAKKLAEHPIKSMIGLSLAGLMTITAVKDNVHFGSTTFHNPQENHYAWGFAPTTMIKGNAKGNFYNFGLIAGENKTGDNTEINGGLSAYGLIIGGNNVGNNSDVKDMSAYGLLAGGNNVGNNSKVNDISAYGLVIGHNVLGNNSEINGNITTKGILANTLGDLNLGSNDVIGLKKYIHKTKDGEGK